MEYFQAYFDHLKGNLGMSELASAHVPLMTSVNRHRSPPVAAMDYRMLASTTSHRLAVIPGASMPSDVLCVFQGLPTAYILRPQEKGNFRIIGEAYVHGIMDGEAMHDESHELRDICLE